MRYEGTKGDFARMSAAVILKTFADHGEQIFDNVTVEQDYENETTTLKIDGEFTVIVHNREVEIV